MLYFNIKKVFILVQILFVYNIYSEPITFLSNKLGLDETYNEIVLFELATNIYSTESNANNSYISFDSIRGEFVKKNNFWGFSTTYYDFNYLYNPSISLENSPFLMNIDVLSFTSYLIYELSSGFNENTKLNNLIDYLIFPYLFVNSELRLYPLKSNTFYLMVGNNFDILLNDKGIVYRESLHAGFTIQGSIGLKIKIEKNIIDLSEPFFISIGVTLPYLIDVLMSV